jgi:carbonic anhydrase/acetyltransferase-like protein (isoleucine patch superfamily)
VLPARDARAIGDRYAPAVQQIDPSAWIAPSAELYGRIAIGAESSL